MLFVGSSWPVAKSVAFMIRSARICPPEDVDIALDIDRYYFAVKVDFADGRPVAWAERPEATNSDD